MTKISLQEITCSRLKQDLRFSSFILKKHYSNIIREAQEMVELAQKAMLRQLGNPLKWHDIGMMILEQRDKFPLDIRTHLPDIAEISKWFRRERELAFYGNIDFIPQKNTQKRMHLVQ
ncbi:MAG: HEPN domain-containing protein [Thermodesulfovibrionales bacterium]|nr:HEPN domain-containing protein [Thermodesulfovibrionales bacterium]